MAEAVWIPAFAGMTGLENGNDGGEIWDDGATTAIFSLVCVDIRPKRTVAAAIKPDFYPVAPALAPVIPAKAGIQTAANAAGTPANALCQHALAPPSHHVIQQRL